MFINIENLSFAYPDGLEPVFSGLNLRLETEWKLAVTGENGMGKTTLLKLLCGELKGQGKISANLTFKRFPFKIEDAGRTPFEIFCFVAPDAEFWRLQKEINLLGLSEDVLYRPYETLSGGERTKFQLAVTFAQDGFALIDEPTDHLDLKGRKQLSKYLSAKDGFIVVSHDRAFLDGCCDHVLALERTGEFLVRGNYSVYAAEREKRKAADAARKEKLEDERARLRRSAARIADWGGAAERDISNKAGGQGERNAALDRGYYGAKAAKMQKRSAAVKGRYERAEGEIKELLKGFEEEEELRLQPEGFFRAELVKLNDIAVRTDGKTLFEGLNLSVCEGERIALVGGNGAGKSTILKLICGILGVQFEISGERVISPRLKISYVPQHCENEGYLGTYAQKYGIEEGYFKAILNKFGFDAKDFTRDMRLFSEGQKKKTALARSLCEKATLYVWDEPLNYLDISSREQIERAAVSSGATVIFVEHDEEFIKNAATRVVEL